MGEFRGKTETLTTRITPAVRSGLEREASRNGRSLSQEVEKRLAASLQEPRKEWGPPHVWLLARLVAKLTRAIETRTQKGWHEDRFTADDVRSAIETLIVHFAPKEDAQTPPAMEAIAQVCEETLPEHPALAESFRKPGFQGVATAMEIISSYHLYDYPALGDPRPFPENFYLMPKIREILAPKKGKKHS
jgi:hypothetical protein